MDLGNDPREVQYQHRSPRHVSGIQILSRSCSTWQNPHGSHERRLVAVGRIVKITQPGMPGPSPTTAAPGLYPCSRQRKRKKR